MNHVQRGHRESGPIHHAANIPIEAHVGEVDFLGGSLALIFLVGIAKGRHVGMTIKRIVIKINLAIERKKVAALCHDKRIDFDLTAVFLDEQSKKPLDKRHQFLDLIRRQTQAKTQVPTLVITQADIGIDVDREDLLRRFRRHLLDLHAALSGSHNRILLNRAIKEHGQIEFVCDG